MRVLFVCLGNICRSPTAEAVVRQLALSNPSSVQWELDSAGTGDYHIGKPPDARSQAAARRRGLDLGSLRARQISAEDFQRFDLILAMDRANLGELQRLRPANSAAQIRLFLDYAPETGVSEMPDPYFGGEAGFETVLDLCMAAGRGLLQAGGGLPPPNGRS